MAKSKKEEIIQDDLKQEELDSQEESEIDGPKTEDESFDDQMTDIDAVEEETETVEEVAPEVEAINTDNDTATSANSKVEKEESVDTNKKSVKKASKATKKKLKKKVRSKAYLKSVEEVDKNKKHTIEEAIDLIKKGSYSKFDGTISLTIKLEKAKKNEDAIRGAIKLPNGTGKKQKVVVATDELIEKIKKGEMDFDILVAQPAMMGKLGQVAKVLGPKGKMPNPKDHTVVENPQDVIEDLSEKIVRYRVDAGRNIHIPVGKVSWDAAKLSENIALVLRTLAKHKKESITLSPTMGPGVKIVL